MKKTFGIAIFAVALSTMAGCVARSYGRFGPPPPPEAMVARHHSGRRAWVPGHYLWTGHRYMWIEGHWR